MKQGGSLVISCGPMANVSPLASTPSAQPPLPTPSPFSYSVASTTWSSRPQTQVSNFILRVLALLFSFVSALSLAAPSSKKNKNRADSSFDDYQAFMFSFIVNILTFLYSAYQLFKGICDIAYRGILISELTSDYISFIFDQITASKNCGFTFLRKDNCRTSELISSQIKMAGYLLISSSSVSVLTIQQMDSNKSLWKAAFFSVSMSFATFLVIVSCALLSGYKLCKRIVW